jgi:hypothetical protein
LLLFQQAVKQHAGGRRECVDNVISPEDPGRRRKRGLVATASHDYSKIILWAFGLERVERAD